MSAPKPAHGPDKLLCLALLLVSCTASHAAIFVKIPNIPGEVLVAPYDDGSWFAVESGSYGADRDLVKVGLESASDLSIGIGVLRPIGLAGYLDRAAPPLAQRAIDGNPVGDVEIHLVDIVPGGGGEPEVTTFGIIRLKRAFVGAFDLASPAGSRPWYQFYLRYNAIEITNRFSNAPGEGITEQTTTWNLLTKSGGFSDPNTENAEPDVLRIRPATVNEDGSLVVPFVVRDADGPAAALGVAATSDDQTLFPRSGLVLSGEGSARTLTLLPAPDRHGTATVTVTVSDSWSSVSTSFVVTVTPAPDAPTIGPVAAQLTAAATPLAVPLAVFDPDQDSGSFLLSAASTNAAVIPASGVTFAFGPGGWQMTLTPPAGSAAGSTDITLTVTDDTGATGSATFLFTVNGPSNSAPTNITLTPGTVLENSPPGSPVGVLAAVDPDPGQDAAFRLVTDAQGLFQVVDGATLVTAPGAVLDYETAPIHRLVVRATDSTGAAFEKVLHVAVLNVNESPAIALAAPQSVPAGTTALKQGEAMFSDPDAGAGDVAVTFKVLHGVLSLDDSGVLSGKVIGNRSRSLSATAVMADLNVVLAETGLSYTSDPGYNGADSLEVSIDDNGHSGEGANETASAAAAFFVQDRPMDAWLRDTFSAAELEDPAVSGLTADGDGDGLNVLIEYKLAKNPKDPSDAWDGISLGPVEDGAQTYFELTFIQRSDAGDADTTLAVDTATGLSGWRSGIDAVQVITRETLPGDLEQITVRSLTPISAEPQQYFRLRVSASRER